MLFTEISCVTARAAAIMQFYLQAVRLVRELRCRTTVLDPGEVRPVARVAVALTAQQWRRGAATAAICWLWLAAAAAAATSCSLRVVRIAILHRLIWCRVRPASTASSIADVQATCDYINIGINTHLRNILQLIEQLAVCQRRLHDLHLWCDGWLQLFM